MKEVTPLDDRWKQGKKRLTAVVLSGLLAAGMVLMPVQRAEAVDAWAAAAQALGVLGAYKSSLSSILSLGNNVNAQVQSRRRASCSCRSRHYRRP